MTEIGKTEALPLAATPAGDLTAGVRIFAVVVVVGVVSAVVAATAGGYWLSTFTKSYCMVLALLGCALLYGQLGLVSLCQWALVGVGGWVSLRVYFWFHPPFVITILAGGVGASVIGMIWGLPALRMRGLYLALVTLMLAGAFQSLITVTRFPVGGPGFLGQVGASGNARVMMARPLYAASDSTYFLFCGVVVILAILLVEWHRRSKPGRAWALIRKSEPMAMASGVRVVFYKAWAFALAGFLAGVAGALLAGTFGQLDPTSGFGPTNSIIIFIGTLLGGPNVWLGSFIGGILTAFVPALLFDLNVQTYIGFVIFGGALLFGLTDPVGLGGHIARLGERLYARVMGRPAVIRIEQLTVQFGGVRPLDALDGAFAAPICGLIGPNGAGKTTLLNVLSGFVTPVKGSIWLDAVALRGHSPVRRVALGLRRTFQQELVVDELTVRENIQSIADHVSAGRAAARAEIDRAIAFVELGERENVPGRQLNLYERRMIEIAKTLIGRPKAILLDEPGAGMNEQETDRLRRLLLQIPERFGAQLILIDHDADLIAAVCVETMVLDFGKLLAFGPTRAVLDDPLVRRAYLGTA